MFADKKVEAAYADAPRFDESAFYGAEEYGELMGKMAKLEKALLEGLDLRQWELFQRYVGLMYEECEFECKHFFQQGWLCAKKDK